MWHNCTDLIRASLVLLIKAIYMNLMSIYTHKYTRTLYSCYFMLLACRLKIFEVNEAQISKYFMNLYFTTVQVRYNLIRRVT